VTLFRHLNSSPLPVLPQPIPLHQLIISGLETLAPRNQFGTRAALFWSGVRRAMLMTARQDSALDPTLNSMARHGAAIVAAVSLDQDLVEANETSLRIKA